MVGYKGEYLGLKLPIAISDVAIINTFDHGSMFEVVKHGEDVDLLDYFNTLLGCSDIMNRGCHL
jgi:hypothetical protein